MVASTWPQRLEDGTAVVALHVEGDRRRIREQVEVLVAQWVASEQKGGQPIPDGLTKLPLVEPCDGAVADVVLESRGSNRIWHGVAVRFQTWLITHTMDSRWVALHDRVGGETRRPLIISG